MTEAMEAEALPIVKRLGLHPDEPKILPAPSTAHSYSGQPHGLSVHLVVNGELNCLLAPEPYPEYQLSLLTGWFWHFGTQHTTDLCVGAFVLILYKLRCWDQMHAVWYS